MKNISYNGECNRSNINKLGNIKDEETMRKSIYMLFDKHKIKNVEYYFDIIHKEPEYSDYMKYISFKYPKTYFHDCLEDELDH